LKDSVPGLLLRAGTVVTAGTKTPERRDVGGATREPR
jgi:hypothetical protein